MTVTTKRDAVVEVLDEYRKTWTEPPARGLTISVVAHDGFGMAEEILRLRAILAALRESSAEVVAATVQAVGSVKRFNLKNIICAAVAAAEQEVDRG